MTQKPIITIVTSTYNIIKAGRKHLFLQMLDSVKNQDYQHIQHIFIDGDSTDGTVELLKSLDLEYISEPDDGIYDAMNKGIKLAKGKYIAFLNSDDYYIRNDAISKSLKALEENKADFLASNVRVIFEDKPVKNYIAYADFKKLFDSIPFCHQGLICKSDIMQDYLFDKKYKLAADYDFIYKLFINQHKGIAFPLTTAAFRADGASQTNNVATENKEIQQKNLQYKQNLLPRLIKENQQNYPIISMISSSHTKHQEEDLEKYQEKTQNQTYPHIEYIIAESSLKEAIARAQGDYIYIFSPHSTFPSTSILEKIMLQFQCENVHAIYSDLHITSKGGTKKKTWDKLWQRKDFLEQSIPYQAFIYKKELFDSISTSIPLNKECAIEDAYWHASLFIEKAFAYAYSQEFLASIPEEEICEPTKEVYIQIANNFSSFLGKKSPYDLYYNKKRFMLLNKLTLLKIEENMWHKKYKILGFLPIIIKK